MSQSKKVQLKIKLIFKVFEYTQDLNGTGNV